MAENTKTSYARTLALASIGGALEFYDFVIFVFVASAIARIFFPPGIPEWVRQVQTFAIFGVGYLVRPLGGIVLAHFGDTRGRKGAFAASLLLMALPTIAIGLLPTYASVGVAAPLLLLLMRVIQGIAIGGEVPGAWVFIAEHATSKRIGLAIGIVTSGLALGIFLGSLTAIALDAILGQAQILRWGWRLPFLLGGVLGLLAVVLRRWLSETTTFQELQEKGRLSRELPLRTVLRDHLRAVIASTFATCMLTSGLIVILLMTPTLLQRSVSASARQMQWANLAAVAAVGFFVIIFGAATDRFGIRRVGLPALILMVGSAYALYCFAPRDSALLLPLYALAGAGVGASVLGPLLMVKAFPAAVRLSGVSATYNVTYALFGGLTPVFVPWLAHLNPISPAHYVAASAVLGASAILLVHLDGGVRPVT